MNDNFTSEENTDLLREVLQVVASKWTALILCRLKSGNKRYSELQKELPGISQKMLTQSLKDLERDGIVARMSYPIIPPRVDYSLTPLGGTLIEPLAGLLQWAEEHIEQVKLARANVQSEDP
jgi:DNA-binding HxlR family transcriptional regulator